MELKSNEIEAMIANFGKKKLTVSKLEKSMTDMKKMVTSYMSILGSKFL